jgi:glucose/arabinose dehydrogenase
MAGRLLRMVLIMMINLFRISQKEGMEQPVRYWVPSIAPCGMTMVTSDKYPNWKGNFLVGALSFQLIARVEVGWKICC